MDRRIDRECYCSDTALRHNMGHRRSCPDNPDNKPKPTVAQSENHHSSPRDTGGESEKGPYRVEPPSELLAAAVQGPTRREFFGREGQAQAYCDELNSAFRAGVQQGLKRAVEIAKAEIGTPAGPPPDDLDSYTKEEIARATAKVTALSIARAITLLLSRDQKPNTEKETP